MFIVGVLWRIRMRQFLLMLVLRLAALAEEGHEPQAKHVERGDACGDQPNQPQAPVAIGWARPGLPQNLVFAEEAAEERRAGNGERCQRHGGESPGNFLAQSSNIAHILLTS